MTNQLTIHRHLSSLLARKKGVFCQSPTFQVGHGNNKFRIIFSRLPIRRLTFHSALQTVFLRLPRQLILIVSRYTQIAGQPGKRCVYDILRCHFYFPHMATDVDHVVSTSPSCAWNNQNYRQWRKLQVSPSTGSVDFAKIDIEEPFPKTTQDNQYKLSSQIDTPSRLGLFQRPEKNSLTCCKYCLWSLAHPYQHGIPA